MVYSSAPWSQAWRPPVGLLHRELVEPTPTRSEAPSRPFRINRPALTRREQEVLALVAEGYSNRRIAERLSISERTVKSHLTNIMTKLLASDRTHAVVRAVRLGCLAI